MTTTGLAHATSLPSEEDDEQHPLDSISAPIQGGPAELQLEVFINEVTTGYVGRFRREADGGLAVEPEELREVGILPQDNALLPDGWISVDRLAGVSAVYEEQAQSLLLTTTDLYRAPRLIDARQTKSGAERGKPESGYGAFVNYTLFANFQNDKILSLPSFNGVSGTFEGVSFSPYGNLTQSLVTKSTTSFDTPDIIRLNSTWSYFDAESLTSYAAGDMISGGLLWTRPVRLGGVQIRRNFSLRPDLVTMPVPSLNGSAAVPSTVEVYANGSRRFQTQVPGGPFQINNLPIVTGPGMARVVVRDAAGREITQDVPFYASNNLLAPGLFDFSMEMGYARNFFGIYSDSYDNRLMGSGTIRYGLTDKLTLEAHAEGGGGLMNGGMGAAFNVGSWGVASGAYAASSYDGKIGHQISGTLEAAIGIARVYLRSQRTFGNYEDVASVTADPMGLPLPLLTPQNFYVKPPRAIDQISVSFPLFDKNALALNFTNYDQGPGFKYQIAGLSYSRPLFSGTAFISAFTDLANSNSYGAFIGYSMQFGDRTSASLSASQTPNGPRIIAEASRSEGTSPGGYGWRIVDAEGAQPYRGAGMSYRGEKGRAEASVQQYESTNAFTATAQGAVVVAGGDVFLTNQVTDSFAVVDVGAPGVAVSSQNRPAGVTGASGRLLVPDMNSYQDNVIDVDPRNLPVDATLADTRHRIMPAARSGVVVKFGIKTGGGSALVTFVDEQGQPLPVGTTVTRSNGADPDVVGYDGQAFLQDLEATNTASLIRPDGSGCAATFEFTPNPGEQVRIEEVVCR